MVPPRVLTGAMASPSALVILADGFEEIEAVVPIDILRRAGVDVSVSCLDKGIHVKGRNGITVHADGPLASFEESVFDCVVLPGGPGVALLRGDVRVIEIVKRQYARGGRIGAICAAPLVLHTAGVLKERRFTAHFSTLGELPSARIADRVVVDGQLITSRGAGTALDFGLKLAEILVSNEKALEVAKSICR